MNPNNQKDERNWLAEHGRVFTAAQIEPLPGRVGEL